MRKIWSLKQKQDAEAKSSPKSKFTAAERRLQKDLRELGDAQYETMKTIFDDPNNIMVFHLVIKPDEGMYTMGTYRFKFEVPSDYPYKPPKVKCEAKIYHPNIDLEGNVCLNILREDWKPVLNLNAICVGLQYLFLEPNADDPLNKAAAEILRRNRDQFVRNVELSTQGRAVDGEKYDDVRNVEEGDTGKGNLNDVLRINAPDSAGSDVQPTAS